MAKLSKQKNPPTMKFYDDKEAVKEIWQIRESGLGSTAWIPNQADTWPGWEDSAVAPEKVGAYLRELKKLFKKYHYQVSVYGHFGQGCVHCRIPFDLKTHQGIKNFRSFLDEAADLVVNMGGSLSGEHGDGQGRAELLVKMFGEELMNAFREFKSIWDPQWKMNPGKVIEPNPITANLRLGTEYNPWNPKTHFQFPHDQGSFARAALRCVGVGICRREGGGIMCPSFMVTKEEKHSTRGRARLLFEMLEGKVIGKQGWRDHSVKEALDLCLSCKGCKNDCPVNVDMAKYKAEFLSHYYAGRVRPISSYAFGYIHRWAQLFSRFPKIINFFTQTPGLSYLSKLMIGMAKNRHIPRFAQQTFKEWFLNRLFRNFRGPGGFCRQIKRSEAEPSEPLPEKTTGTPGVPEESKIILWVDTFTNYFEPSIPIAATQILEKLGYDVIVPLKNLCCGRPLYDFGILKPAKKLLIEILDNLRSSIRAGIPIVGLEPSCVATFRDELIDLFPHDEDALRLQQQTFLLSELLVNQNKLDQLPVISRPALVQIHCHHHSVMKMDAEQKVLKKLGLDFEILNAGCCGMAGSFGYEQGQKYEVSVKAAERELAPKIRKTPEDTLIIADGFSCRTQIYDQTGRKALHLAEVIHLAMGK